MNTERNIVITGFMGTGKSSVGRIVAERLGRPFVDTDELLVQRAGKPISAIFAEDGEEKFRADESAICREVAALPGQVIATGGGALVSAENRAALGASGLLVCLTASVDAILARVGEEEHRPLLSGSPVEQRERIESLLRSRRSAYGAIPQQVDTSSLTPEGAAERVLECARVDALAPGAFRIPVTHPQGSYPIFADEGLLNRAGPLLVHQGIPPGRIAVVTNQTVAERHFAVLEETLRETGFQPAVVTVQDGERFKTLATVQRIYEDLLAAGLDRHGTVLALGGGVIGDMAGFAAATYLRGVRFVQAPTTLLSMVDASVGGKTGVDMPEGKNLIGAFKQPELVLLDTATLETLPAAEFRSGLAEVIKHGIIGDPDLFAQFEGDGPASVTQMVVDAVRVKIEVVEEDPFETGRRAVLNLGHTFGHAMELESHFAIRHGEAVAIGLVAASNLAVECGCCEPELATRIRAVVQRAGLPVTVRGHRAENLLAAMRHDKKRAGKTLRFVVPRALGDVTVIDSPGDAAILQALKSVIA